MEVSASLIKDLREKTGAGFMDCKRLWLNAPATSNPPSTFCAVRVSPQRPIKRDGWLRRDWWVPISTQGVKSAFWWRSIAKPTLSRARPNFRLWSKTWRCRLPLRIRDTWQRKTCLKKK